MASRGTDGSSTAKQDALPLRDRLPNAPTDFVGRSWERDRLKRLLQRGRAAIVTGPPGIGKSALVLEVLHRAFASRIGRTIYIAVRAGREDVRVRVVRALAEASRAQEQDWAALLAAPDELIATAVDLADLNDWWVVLDDVQNADATHVAHLFSQASRFARRARWIACGRSPIATAELGDQTIVMEPMTEQDLTRLANVWAPRKNKAALKALAIEAAGSPWKLRCVLFGTTVDDTPTTTTPTSQDTWSALPVEAQTLLLALARLEHPLAPETVAQFVALPSTEIVQSLERRGLLESTPRGWRLPDIARTLLGPHITTVVTPAARAMADALVLQTEPVAVVEGLRLLAAQHRSDDALRALDTRGVALLSAGYAPDLWRALQPGGDDPRLARWRLRCTVEFDSPAVLSAAVEQSDPSPDDRLAWAHVLFRRGRIDAAERAADAALVAARTVGDEPTVLDASVLRARAIAQQGREAEALASLDGLIPRDASSRARLDALSAMLLTALDRRNEARARVARLRSELPSLPTPAQLEVGFGVVQALYFLGQYREADEAIRDLVQRTGETALALSHGRRLLFYRASIAIECGRLADARELLARLQAFADGRSMFRAFVDFAAATLHLAAGELEALDALLPKVIAAGRALGEWTAPHVEALLLASRVAWLTGRAPVAALPDEQQLPQGEGYPARPRVRLASIESTLRAGTVLQPSQWPRPDDYPAWGDTRVMAWSVRARAALLSDDLALAREAADAALRDVTDGGSALAEADVRSLLGDVHGARGDAQEVARAAQALAEFARNAPSARYEAEARLLQAAGFGGRPEPAELERLAASGVGHAAHVVRRAHALLGSHVDTLDALDQRFVTSARAAWKGVALQTLPAASATTNTASAPCWGIDVKRMELWRSNSADVVSFRDRALLFRVLVVLAERGGRASKEELVLAVWDEREYHPLKHDNRLRLAVRKLRQSFEDDAAQPSLLLTTEDGYALGGTARWMHEI